ncbi:DUF2867 domain-containing protein [Georgenia sp. 311]|uniref:DUF2867 domain-containing protein n=1 Tax=Georgenia sp. 311 TaxID=2585134 RepID=UPI00210013D1|nr:DUF2867 domain-containing protein [Georgenia sp. 311]
MTGILAHRERPGGSAGRRLPPEAHADQPWIIHKVAPDFRLEDVWSIDVHGGADELPRLVATFATDDFPESAPLLVRGLWKARWVIGRALGWDGPDDGLESRVASLRDRLPDDVPRVALGRDLPGVAFLTLYETREEWAAEIANATVHAVMHLGWVPDGKGAHRGQMAVLVRPNGRLGRLYMAAIRPLRYRVVYPALLRGIERRWAEGAAPRQAESPTDLVPAPEGRRAAGGAGRSLARNLRDRWWSNRLPEAEHTDRAWRIHEIAPDFEVEDVWVYRTPGAGPDDFPVMLAALRAAGGLNENPPLVRLLFAVRWKLGGLLGWDTPGAGLSGRVDSLLDRLPADLRQDAAGEAVPHTPFTLVYELADECVIELANKTVHDLTHLGWVPSERGGYELRMAALVKPNGRFGRMYMKAIKPFRYLIVYPALTRKWERAWRERHRYVGHAGSART